MRENNMCLFRVQNDPEPMKIIQPETLTTVEKAAYMKQKYAFHLEVNGKKHLYFHAENVEQMDDWVRLMQDLAPEDVIIESYPHCPPNKIVRKNMTRPRSVIKDESEELNKEEQEEQVNKVMQTKLIEKKEQDKIYETSQKEMMRVGFSQEQIEQYKKLREAKEAKKEKPKSIYADLLTSTLIITVPEVSVKNAGQRDMYASYTVEIYAKVAEIEQSWTVYRRYTQFYDLMRDLFELHLDFEIPAKTKSVNVHPDLLEERRKVFGDFSAALCRCQTAIFSQPHLAFVFAKFFGPVQVGDVRPPGFVMVFPLVPP